MKSNHKKWMDVRNGLKKAPIFVKFYLGGSLSSSIISVTMIIMRFGFLLYTVDPYYLICTVIISSTLLMMTIMSIKKDGEENKDDRI